MNQWNELPIPSRTRFLTYGLGRSQEHEMSRLELWNSQYTISNMLEVGSWKLSEVGTNQNQPPCPKTHLINYQSSYKPHSVNAGLQSPCTPNTEHTSLSKSPPMMLIALCEMLAARYEPSFPFFGTFVSQD